MLSRYLKKDGFWPVPETKCKIFVNIEGQVKINGQLINCDSVDSSNSKTIMLDWYNGYREYTLADLVARTFKPTFIPCNKWHLMTLLYKDNNSLNINAANLIWKFITPIESDKYPEYYHIPGFSRFLINKKCEAKDILTGNSRTHHFKDNYIYYSVKPDIGDWTLIGRHRLLSLAFKSYNGDVNKLDVNHIDGIPGNDVLENLEFVTRTINCNHAFKLGLKKYTPVLISRLPVLVRNVKSNTVTEFKTKMDASRFLGISIATLDRYLRTPNQPVFIGDIQVKLKSDETSWNNDFDINNISYHEFHSRRVLVINTITNEETIYPSMSDCSKAFNVSKDTIHWRLKKLINPTINNVYKLSFLNK